MGIIGITGHNSFIGRHLVTALNKASLSPLLFKGDIRNPAEVSAFMRECDTVYHLAGCNRGSDKDVYEINMIGGTNIVASALAHGNRHIIFITSNYIFRDPDNPYSISKKSIEDIMQMISGVNNCRTSLFRLSNTYGPLALPFHVSVVASFCWYEANGMGDKMPIIGDGSQSIELVPINEVIKHLIMGMDNNNPYSLSVISGRRFSISELAETIHNPDKRKSFPSLTDTVSFFSKSSGLRMAPLSSVETVNDNLFKVNYGNGQSVLIEQHEVINIEPGYQRHIYRSFKQKCWIFLSEGRAAIDIFFRDEEYFNTVLVDDSKSRCVEVTEKYIYRIRNLSSFLISIRLCYETDSSGI